MKTETRTGVLVGAGVALRLTLFLGVPVDTAGLVHAAVGDAAQELVVEVAPVGGHAVQGLDDAPGAGGLGHGGHAAGEAGGEA